VRTKLYHGQLLHHRLTPKAHRFEYPVCGWVLDLDELGWMDRHLSGFGYNRFAPMAIHDADYLGPGSQPLAEKVGALLVSHGKSAGRILLVTSARFFGHAFNPASFYFCFDERGALGSVIAEVNNTFGERHAYLLDQPLPPDGWFARYRVPKAFYVSPFNKVEGDYEFRFADPRETVDIRLRWFCEEKLKFNSCIRGALRPAGAAELLKTVVRYPLTVWLTLPRIHWEAAVLYFKKRLPIVHKHRPEHPMGLRADPPTALHRFGLKRVLDFLGAAEVTGSLTLDLPSRESVVFGQTGGPGIHASLRVQNYDLFLRLLVDGDVGLGDGYRSGQWESPNPTDVVRFFLDNRQTLDDRQVSSTRWLGRWLRRGSQLLRSNTLRGSRRNIAAHYDLGNALYASFLDSTMSYSCGYYARESDDLAQAQRNKIGKLLGKARLGPSDHVLEIGCGWGSLAIEAVRSSGCRVTAITLSERQLEWARAAVTRAGLGERIEVRLCDYREIEGQFTRILSVEMLEAVGHENLGRYFQQLERCLAPEGLVVLQAITVPDHSYSDYRRQCDWVQKEIFPGAVIPSLAVLMEAMASNSKLRLEEFENIGPHYARTLRDWRLRFVLHWKDIQGSYDENFRRAWIYYLCYCEAAFASLNLANLQLVLARPQNKTLALEVPSWL
jgi:cyclopropane-fatty-acyl-phospholipid synthase